MKKDKIALDVDGVIANFYLAVCRRFNHPYETVERWYLPWLTSKMFDEVARDNEFWRTLPVLNPPEAITFDFQCYMTAVPHDQLESRIQWLKDNGFPNKPVIVSHDKISDCKILGIDVLIDDKPDTILAAADAGIKAIRFVPQYFYEDLTSHSSYKIIRHLDEVNKFIKK